MTERIHRLFEAAADAEAARPLPGPEGSAARGFGVG